MSEALMGVKSYVIPARPEVLIKISQLVARPDSDVNEIVAALKQDVSLYTIVLATANTPLFRGRNKISSLNHAVTRLGLKRLNNIVKIISLKNTLSKVGRVERFWDTATEIAEITTKLSTLLSKENPDEAYTLGMLHDCGIPLMMDTFPDYRSFLQDVNGNNLSELHIQEADKYGYNHFDIGSEIASHWHMPDAVCEAIKFQPNYINVLNGNLEGSESSKLLLCYLQLAKGISETYRHYWRISSPRGESRELQPILEYIGLPEIDYLDIRDDFLAALERIQ